MHLSQNVAHEVINKSIYSSLHITRSEKQSTQDEQRAMVRVAHYDFNKFGVCCDLCVCERERQYMLVYMLVPLSDNIVLYHNLQTQEQYFKICRCLQLGLDLTLLCKVTGHNKILCFLECWPL